MGWIALGSVGFRHQFSQAGTSVDPFFDVVTLILWTSEVSASDLRALAWVMGASVAYGVGGGLLMVVAQARAAVARPAGRCVARGCQRARTRSTLPRPELVTHEPQWRAGRSVTGPRLCS